MTPTIPFASGIMGNVSALGAMADNLECSERMPLLFVGHGSPMNAIDKNVFSLEMREVGRKLPKPKAILCISAHWETNGSYVTAQENPATIHDFGGFPQALFDVQYPAPGSPWLAQATSEGVANAAVKLSFDWGLDHGCWSVTRNLFPKADIPIVQLSLDRRKGPAYHYALGKEISNLRDKGVLILGSGNMVHNFSEMAVRGGDFNAPFGHEWALEANESFKKWISSGNHQPLIDYRNQGPAIALAVPTPEHYLPLLYTLGAKTEKDKVLFFNDAAVGGSFTMTSLLIGG
jgi:4,5-DOPA dioxygenase extradiol